MNLYVVSRSRAWRSREELAASSDCLPAILDTFAGEIRWVRSYLVDEGDGTYGAHCFYEATSAEKLEELADAMMLPADSIKPVLQVT
jgi:hypothetical protein